MVTSALQKYEQLKRSIGPYGRVGVAFSGGIDSSLLLFAAGEALGKENVLALHARSQLSCEDSDINKIFAQNFDEVARLKIIDLNPLSWPDFAGNDDARCYHCKKKTYTVFWEHLAKDNITVLLDGTNADDLSEHRPGYAVLEELQVYAPLVGADIGKKEIRFLAKSLGLTHYNLPSNSCLATRLGFLSRIADCDLDKVKKIEGRLRKMGLAGCRVRPMEKGVFLEVRQQDFLKISRIHVRIKIINLCRSEGFADVFLNLRGR